MVYVVHTVVNCLLLDCYVVLNLDWLTLFQMLVFMQLDLLA